MEQFSFDTFKVNSENRRAVDVCLAVARLQAVMPQPVMLVGASGAGKTHLLCAMVNYVQQNAPKTALVYVTAKSFPEAARALAEDARPVTRARAAVLLVDQLEKFTPELLELLSRVAPLFVSHGRWMVVAAQCEPASVPGLPEPLRELLSSGQVVPVGNVEEAARTESDNAQLRHELQETLAELRISEQEARALQRALEEMRRQRDACQSESAALAAANAELSRLREISSEAAPPSAVAEEQVRQAQQVAKDAEVELDRWAMKAQALLQQVELHRVGFAENAEVQLQQVLALRQRVRDMAESATAVSETAGGDAEQARVLSRELDDISEAAAQLPAVANLPAEEAESRIQTLYAQLLRAAQSIQELSDRVNEQAGESGHAQARPWYADPFPLPKKGPAQEPQS